ncbi:prolipoprotein diacylglyceryl transferase [Algivirga pacifica]|uniref:Phosphatidylglycerol--prolipoprotein diacylglyceryl transferase n=1 Tax=Algivirga pacifica TaxID=1162670 RepID=A0ABP9DI79_9BACT
MNLLQYITWNVDPEIFNIGFFSLRWYGLLFASGFFIGQFLMIKMYKNDGRLEKDVDSLTMYMLIATVLGARLGHCFFYDPEYYLSNPIKIFKVWEGGLASHGAAIGILTGLWMYSKKYNHRFLWVVDRVVVVVALAGGFIRMGNLMNSEIVGIPSDLPWAFLFERLGDYKSYLVEVNGQLSNVPRHPVQLYEAITYFITFGVLWKLYWSKGKELAEGRLFGLFLVLVFGFRIVWEFLKVHQADFMMGLELRMGQLLSIPLVLAGFYFLLRKTSSEKKEANIS